jgi:hypothetical protein
METVSTVAAAIVPAVTTPVAAVAATAALERCRIAVPSLQGWIGRSTRQYGTAAAADAGQRRYFF